MLVLGLRNFGSKSKTVKIADINIKNAKMPTVSKETESSKGYSFVNPMD